MRHLNPGLFPPGGFYFIEPADGMRIDADSMDQLVRKVANYRNRIQRPLGIPRNDIEAQICERSPGVCRDGGESIDAKEAGKALVAAVVENAQRLQEKKDAKELFFVSPEVVAGRVEICRACPHRADWQVLCPPCQKDASKLLKAIAKPNKLPEALEGQACLNAQDDLSLAAVVQHPEGLENVPHECWRRARSEAEE